MRRTGFLNITDAKMVAAIKIDVITVDSGSARHLE